MYKDEEDFKKRIFALEVFLQAKVLLFFREDLFHANFQQPWSHKFFSNLSVAELIAEIWKPVQEYSKDFVDSFAHSVLDVVLVVSPEGKFPTSLMYVIKRIWRDQAIFDCWLAGPPATNEDFVTHEVRLGLQIPFSYKVFSGVHNGFVEDGNYGKGYLSLDRLFSLAEFDYKDCLGFYNDGGGNMQVYHTTMPFADNDYMTVDWDHESREIYKPETFWAFLERFRTTLF